MCATLKRISVLQECVSYKAYRNYSNKRRGVRRLLNFWHLRCGVYSREAFIANLVTTTVNLSCHLNLSLANTIKPKKTKNISYMSL